MSNDESELSDHERPKVRAILQNLILRELYRKAQDSSEVNVSALVSTNMM